jgi:parallel beta-helix repeat protein
MMLAAGSPAQAATTCDKAASPSGSDTAAGTVTAPYRTAQRLVDSLSTGQTGCLRAGTYSQNVSISKASTTLTSYPGETAKVVGRFWVKQGANYVTVSNLVLDGANSSGLPSPTVNGNNDTFTGNDVSNEHTVICFNVGNDDGWGRAVGTVISRNRIHDCGGPNTNKNHGIYVVAADNTQIVDNVIYNNADRGVQLYPNAQGTVVRGNIISGNGEGVIFSGDNGTASSNNVVENNIITGSTIRTNVESWYPAGNPVGTGNVVRNNCIGGAKTAAYDTSGGGFTMGSSNVSGDPKFVSSSGGDFRLATTSPCASLLSASAAPAGLAAQAPDSLSGTTTTVSTTPITTTTPPATTTPVATPPATTTPVATPPATTPKPVTTTPTKPVTTTTRKPVKKPTPRHKATKKAKSARVTAKRSKTAKKHTAKKATKKSARR